MRQRAAGLPSGRFGIYLLVGAFNTLFGYATYALLTALLVGHLPAPYMFASALASVLNITFSFLGHKWFVFRTSGNYFSEWARSLVVYSGSIVMGLALLPLFVFVLSRATGGSNSAPYLAGAVLIGLQAIVSFQWHGKFTFRDRGGAGGSADAQDEGMRKHAEHPRR